MVRKNHVGGYREYLFKLNKNFRLNFEREFFFIMNKSSLVKFEEDSFILVKSLQAYKK
jgi:hypothetical protein